VLEVAGFSVMLTAARVCMGFGAACLVGAFATELFTGDAGSLLGVIDAFGDLTRRGLLVDPVWRWLLWALGASGLVALGVSGISAWLDRPRARGRSLQAPAADQRNRAQWIAEVGRRITRELEGSAPSVVRAFEAVVRGALEVGASDIHFSPTPETLRITYRALGVLYEAASLDLRWSQPFSTRIKVLSGLETHVRQRPQDGRLNMQLDGVTVEARVSSLPTEVGERLVLRIVRGTREVPELASLGLSEQTQRGLMEALARPQGLVFVTGPVGSGKTTTLYSALKHVVDTRGRLTSVVTLEDPIELELPFATQTQMHARAGRTFAGTLRSVLRQDPNVLMIGEIRDKETAQIATQAGLTGHLILTTVHADGAAGPFSRLIEMQVEPFIVASATIACISQRLVRTLCPLCSREEEPDAGLLQRFTALGAPVPNGSYHVSVGCEACAGEGFSGRAPISEILIMRPELRQAVIDCKPTSELLDAARQFGLTPLLSDGLERAVRGQTSLAEVLRVTG
jgi:general secretion pathway protein E